ncbi:unnamed protein product [Medioppia subpectinata]|uniref:nitric-oxide synthase (NADPH) n=1 Tax=Medioppia subpectinata TaxID=1979941 RepID=A0A7R9PX05_9ACAR|nr:unnamed protein product [Medioppia subpectinata]CAG2104321.1 unnamed protein product [Medioppia subpectinata]
MADVLNEFHSVHVDPEFLLSELPLLQPRYYSISSSQKVTPDEVQLTMDLVSYHIHDGMGPKRFGICSSFINSFPNVDIPCYLRSAPAFRLPDNKKVPIIMIGAGSGIAPFRGFWLQRQADLQNGEESGKMFLFFGCRNSQTDSIYGTDLADMARKGVLHELFYAYSQEKGHKKQYVQDQVFKQRSLLYWLIVNEKAHIYVCGHSLMADGVKKSFGKVFENAGKMNETEAQELLTQVINDGRYHEDVFGLLHR